jgi:uncharacterized protein (DUF433 family)
VLVGKSVVKGTRLSVAFLLDLKSSGGPDEQILKSCPQLMLDDLVQFMLLPMWRI